MKAQFLPAKFARKGYIYRPPEALVKITGIKPQLNTQQQTEVVLEFESLQRLTMVKRVPRALKSKSSELLMLVMADFFSPMKQIKSPCHAAGNSNYAE